MPKDLKIRIGDVSISIEGDFQKSNWEIPPAYRPFIRLGKTDMSLRLHQGALDNLVGEKVFDCPPIWTLYRQNGTSVIRIFHTLSDPERTLVLPRHLEKADLYFAEKYCRFIDPFYGPTMELLMLNYLAQGRGVIIHSCAIARNGRGILFVGESGAGKSTWASIWEKGNNATVLSDDRIIVRKKNGVFWIYGTPWHGDVKLASPRGVPLEKVFFIRHDLENTAKRLVGIEAISKYLVCSFAPFWNPEGMEFTLAFLSDLSSQVPGYDIGFLPDSAALDFIMAID